MVPKPVSYAKDEAALLQSRLRQSLSLPAGSTGPDALQGRVGPFGCQGTLLIQLSRNQKPQIPFHRAALQSLMSQFVHISRVVPFQMQNATLVKFWQLMISHPSNLSGLISLQGLCTLKGVNSSSQFSVTHKIFIYSSSNIGIILYYSLLDTTFCQMNPTTGDFPVGCDQRISLGHHFCRHSLDRTMVMRCKVSRSLKSGTAPWLIMNQEPRVTP